MLICDKRSIAPLSHSERDPVSQARRPYCDSEGGNDISENRSGLSTASSKVQTTKGTCDQLPPGDEGTSAYEEVKIYLRNKVWMFIFLNIYCIYSTSETAFEHRFS